MGLFSLFFCCGRRKPRQSSGKSRKLRLARPKKVSVKVDGGTLHMDGLSGRLASGRGSDRHLAVSPSSPRTDFMSEDGYESATSELNFPNGIISPTGSHRLEAGHFDSLVDEVDVIEPDSPSSGLGCIGSKPRLSSQRYMVTSRPRAGSSVRQHNAPDDGSASCSVEDADGRTFMVRSLNYMKNKVKEPSAPALYRLLGADMYSFEFKIFHIAHHVQLPRPPKLGPRALALPPAERLPPILVINLQLPMYGPSLFGANDGPGHSLVYYFALPEGWEPDQVPNKPALEMLQRFFHDGREHDGQHTRDRLKLIPRVANVEEWAVKAPLSGYEHRLITNYNDKPILTRPQHRFYRGEHYCEIDVDVHNYAYLARKAFFGFVNRLAPLVFENAFVVQGNRPEELPEVVLAAVRVHRVDFSKSQPFPAQTLEERGLLQHRATDSGLLGNNPAFAAAAAAAVAEAEARRGSAGSPGAQQPQQQQQQQQQQLTEQHLKEHQQQLQQQQQQPGSSPRQPQSLGVQHPHSGWRHLANGLPPSRLSQTHEHQA